MAPNRNPGLLDRSGLAYESIASYVERAKAGTEQLYVLEALRKTDRRTAPFE
jgi:hypothetical protein